MEHFANVKPEDPTLAWNKLKETEVGDVTDLDWEDFQNPEEEKKDGTLRVVCVSDTHTKTDDMQLVYNVPIPDGDILIHAGDFSNTGELKDIVDFNKWLNAQPHKHKIVIAGNHDTSFDVANYDNIWSSFHSTKQDPAECRSLLIDNDSVTYLENSSCVVEGLTIWGSPWTPRFHDWGFNATRGEPCAEIWRDIPVDTDILITHGPPLGHGDLCFGNHRAGCLDLFRELTTRVHPYLHVFGHVHEGYGVTTNGKTLFANASTCNFRYKPKNPPLVFDVPLKRTGM
eukprot:TRINITY_DN2915_c0_g1_i1.p1 TRINITY_DN2915_c0_g1~~TRINITY_DN2915_c0_g1_i1.p1  ORF type:complete len:285 (+),score=32.37 TRINITY_DN2915_c0_g1_i1:86-940(+)